MTARRPSASLLRNTAAQSTPLLLGYVLSFASAPIVLAGLGIRDFGIWALTGAIAQYIALLDGFGPSVSRFIALHQDDRRACGEYIGAGLVSGTLVSGAAVAAAIVGAGPLSRALGGISTGDMRIVGIAAAVLLFSSCLSAAAAAFAIGHRRMVVPNLGLTIGSVAGFVASVGSIALGAGLPGYAMANAGAGLVSAFAVVVFVTMSEGRLPVSWPSRKRLLGFTGYSLKYQVVSFAFLLNYQTDKIVIAFSVGPSAAGAYELGNRVAAAARQIGVYPTTALLPTMTADFARGGIDAIRWRYARLTEITVTFAFPPLFLAAALAPLLLGAWLSNVPPDTTAVLAALSIGYVANASSGVSYVFAASASDPGLPARAGAVTALANLLLTAALAPIFGLWGVLAGTVLALTVGAFLQIFAVHRRFALPLQDYWRAVVPPVRVCLLLSLPAAIVGYSSALTGRTLQAVATVAISLLYLALYATWAVRTDRVPVKFKRWLMLRIGPDRHNRRPASLVQR
jgi:O-antigen/teichoic acid export membrane protein